LKTNIAKQFFEKDTYVQRIPTSISDDALIFKLIFVFLILGFERDVLNHNIAVISTVKDFIIGVNATKIFILHLWWGKI
jgi:hypothetical protein